MCLAAEERCNSPMHVSYNGAHSRDFDVTVEYSAVSGAISGLIDPTQALRGSGNRWQMPTEPHVMYTFRVRFVRPCDTGWYVERLAFTVEGVDVFQLAVGNHVVVREVRLSVSKCHTGGRVKLLSAAGSEKALFRLTAKNDIAAGSELIAAEIR